MFKIALLMSVCLLGLTSALGGLDKVLHFETEQNDNEEIVGNSTCTNSKYFCANNTTCCPGFPPVVFACCPYPQGVCCGDRKHCCPRGTHCDIPHGRCYRQIGNDIEYLEAGKSKSLDVLSIKEYLSIQNKRAKSVVCPGGSSQCPDSTTCCLNKSGQYGCCPIPQATCCSDRVHCCPNGYTCDVSAGTCNRGRNSFPLYHKLPSTPIATVPELKSIVCPDGQSECPDGNTCCKSSTSTYGCCPRPQAVCCKDGTHCCPKGYTCDATRGGCVTQLAVVPFLRKVPALELWRENVVCPGGQFECPTGATCCRLASGMFGCCPLPMAMCCSDGVHCCPNGYTCDVSAGSCNRGDLTVPFFKKAPALSKKVENVVCPGGQSECPSGTTCCKTSSGQYGCCPMPKAVCCSDGVHCCPNGYTCDVSAGTCQKRALTIPFLKKTPAMSKKLENVICPGGQSECPSGTTCCKTSSGQYGCCPMPKAVCCSDGVHCCPNGYTCDVSAGTCHKGALTVPFLKKTLAMSKKVENVVCPGGQSECPSETTCCKDSSGEYGCCPLPKAVCCSDGVHCCPNGYTCDVSAGTCQKGALTVPFLKKTSAMSKKLENVVCPGGQSECPSGTTCCKTSSGQYGCCPMPKAVCCSDGVHCCPNGYTCGTGTCLRGGLSQPLLKKSPSLPSQATEIALPKTSAPKKDIRMNLCPNGAACGNSETCCLEEFGGYGCCPFRFATCCSDGVSCCPRWWKCNAKTNRCEKDSAVLPLFVRLKSQPFP